jgi:hypothetical protein
MIAAGPNEAAVVAGLEERVGKEEGQPLRAEQHSILASLIER